MTDLKDLTAEQLRVIIHYLEKRLWEEGVEGNYYYAGSPTEEEYIFELECEYEALLKK